MVNAYKLPKKNKSWLRILELDKLLIRCDGRLRVFSEMQVIRFARKQLRVCCSKKRWQAETKADRRGAESWRDSRKSSGGRRKETQEGGRAAGTEGARPQWEQPEVDSENATQGQSDASGRPERRFRNLAKNSGLKWR